MSEQLYPKRWYGMVYRQIEGYPTAVLSTIIEPNLTVHIPKTEDERLSPPPRQRLRDVEINDMVASAQWHVTHLKKRVTEFKSARWYMEIMEVSPMEEMGSAIVVDTIKLE